MLASRPVSSSFLYVAANSLTATCNSLNSGWNFRSSLKRRVASTANLLDLAIVILSNSGHLNHG